MEWRNGPRRPKRETELGGMASVLEGIWGSESIRFRRDVSETTKYIETAIVIDKAMFEKRNGSTRAEVIHDAIQVANIADLVSAAIKMVVVLLLTSVLLFLPAVFSYDKHAGIGGVHRDVAEQEPDPHRGRARHQPGNI